MRIFCGDFEVLDSGTITSPDLSDTRFLVSEEHNMTIVFRIVMECEETGIRLEVLDENTLAVVFERPNGLGYGPATPIKVGTLDGKALYVSFRVAMRGNDVSYGLEYTFYLKEVE
ncbi:DUF6864 domain-containing function [Photobacterium leiognathi]|uniref:DUF6864 domain-containing function n=1 Tax=Photobacterium leiognathi TaxID=553611 RepID=UPI00387F4ED1